MRLKEVREEWGGDIIWYYRKYSYQCGAENRTHFESNGKHGIRDGDKNGGQFMDFTQVSSWWLEEHGFPIKKKKFK